MITYLETCYNYTDSMILKREGYPGRLTHCVRYNVTINRSARALRSTV